jgi:hypothetical protein
VFRFCFFLSNADTLQTDISRAGKHNGNLAAKYTQHDQDRAKGKDKIR